jgi:Ribbon-helix-helix protein, copG family.
MEQLTVSISAEAKSWIKEQAEENDTSHGHIIRQLIAERRAMSSGISLTGDNPEVDSVSAKDIEALDRQLGELEGDVEPIDADSLGDSADQDGH